MSKRKILIVNDCAEGGGVEKVMKLLVEHWGKQGDDITLFLPEYTKIVQKQYPLVKGQIPYFIFKPDTRVKRLINRVWERIVKKYLSYKYFDVVIAMKEGDSMKRAADIIAKCKLAWVHTDYSKLHWSKGCFKSDVEEVLTMQKYDYVVCVSETVKKNVIKAIGNPGNLCTCYNPINVEQVKELAGEKMRVKRDTVQFVTLGRLAEEKGYGTLLKVCERLFKQGYRYELFIIGDGPERSRYEDYVVKHNLKGISFLGKLDNPYPYLKNADCLISASKTESFGLAIQEALILGTPVIATWYEALEELFLEGIDGIIVDNNADALYEGMKSVLEQPDILQGFRQKIEDKIMMWDLEKQCATIDSLLGGK